MLFSSLPFIFVFLPLFLFFWRLLSKNNPASRLRLLFLFSSALFYALWGAGFAALLFAAILFNFLAAMALSQKAPFRVSSGLRRGIFAFAVCVNLLSLVWFKYSLFIMDNIEGLFNLSIGFAPPALPPGLSFYTFIQIAWLYDIYKREARIDGFCRHALFSCGFPWVLSGPIIRARDVSGQLAGLGPLSPLSCAKGFSLFSIGLSKKLVLADSCGLYADNVFNAAQTAWPVSFAESWAGSLFYTFQLYFDFSGYTDMALGLGLMAGLTLPENFNSPYKSTGVIEFWRRWHITLGLWLRDFIYIPLGGNRKGRARQYLNLFITMLLGGIWHGAGWTFILWGALHGFMLVVNHAWRNLKKSWPPLEAVFHKGRLISIIFTFICLNFCWVVFRASSLDAALLMYKSMLDPAPLLAAGGLSPFLAGFVPHNYISGWQPAFLLCLSAGICFFAPASREIVSFVFERERSTGIRPALWAGFFAFLAFAAIVCSGRQSAFLYFQF